MLIVTYLSIALTSGLRFETGTDYNTYNDIFNDVNTLGVACETGTLMPFDSSVEIGYLILCSAFKTIGLNINMMFLFISLITTALLFYSVKKYIPEYFYFGIILYFCYVFFLMDMSGVRQAIALNLFIYSIRYCLSRKFFKFLVFIVIAMTFHTSAFILLLCYPIINRRFSKLFYTIVLFCSIAILILKLAWIESMFQLLGSIFISGPMAGKIVNYATNEFLTQGRELSPVMLLYVPIFLTAVWWRERLETPTPYYTIFLNLFTLFIISVFAFYESQDISIRISMYFIVGFCLIFPLFLSVIKAGANKLIAMTFILLLSLYSTRSVIIGNEITTIMYRPYQNYLWVEMGIQQSDAESRKNQFIEAVE